MSEEDIQNDNDIEENVEESSEEAVGNESKEVFKVVFTDGEVKYVEGTNLLNRTNGGVSIIDEDEGTDLQSYLVVITVPQHTLKYAFTVDKELEESETEDEVKTGFESDGELEESNTTDDEEVEEFWDEDSLWDKDDDTEASSSMDEDIEEDVEPKKDSEIGEESKGEDSDDGIWADEDDIEIDDDIKF